MNSLFTYSFFCWLWSIFLLCFLFINFSIIVFNRMNFLIFLLSYIFFKWYICFNSNFIFQIIYSCFVSFTFFICASTVIKYLWKRLVLYNLNFRKNQWLTWIRFTLTNRLLWIIFWAIILFFINSLVNLFRLILLLFNIILCFLFYFFSFFILASIFTQFWFFFFLRNFVVKILL